MSEPPKSPHEPPDGGSLPPNMDPELSGLSLPLKLRSARYVITGLLVAIIITVVSFTYLRIEKQLRQTLSAQLDSVLTENVHTVSAWLEDQASLSARVAQSTKLETILDQSAQLSLEERQELLRTSLFPFSEAALVDDAALFDSNGKLVAFLASTSPPPRLSNEARGTNQVATVRVLRNSDGLRVNILRAFGPVSAPKGFLSLTNRAENTPSFPRAFRKGRTYVFDLAGELKAEPQPQTASLPSVLLARQEPRSASSRTDDYIGRNGEEVIGAWKWLPEYQLGIAAEVPRDQALSSVARLRRSFLVLVILVGAAVLGFIALGRWTLRVREESLLMTRRLGRLARAIQPLSAALEHDPSAVVLVDAEGAVVYANAASHRVLGVNAPLLGQDVDDVFDNLHAELQAALISGRDSIVAQGTGNDDETLLVSSRNLTIDGNPHYLYMLRPVTQQVRRQEVEHWKKLIRVLSHELNNALAPITSLLSSARKVNQMTHQDPRLGSIFESIAERTGHLVSFIEGYREVARLPRPDQREVNWEVFLSGLEAQKNFRRIGTTPSRPGYFDPSQMERVIVNVVNNAYEAGSKPEDICIEVSEESIGFRVNVMDRGSGMPEPVLKQAMLPFFSTKRTGTGVGLALSREIIEAHGGQLTLANRDGGGLVVSCLLPHPVQPTPHPSRSRLPISIINPTEDSEPPLAPPERT